MCTYRRKNIQEPNKTKNVVSIFVTCLRILKYIQYIFFKIYIKEKY